MHYDQFREALKEAADSLADNEKKREVAVLATLDDYVGGAVVYGNYEDGDDSDDMYNYSEPEFLDFLEVNMFGAKKHGNANWLQPNGTKSSHRDMYASIFRHVAEGYAGKTADDESGLHPVLHAVSRLLMVYTRYKRGLVHDDDVNLHAKYNIYK